jgi:hypothetical protein
MSVNPYKTPKMLAEEERARKNLQAGQFFADRQKKQYESGESTEPPLSVAENMTAHARLLAQAANAPAYVAPRGGFGTDSEDGVTKSGRRGRPWSAAVETSTASEVAPGIAAEVKRIANKAKGPRTPASPKTPNKRGNK